MPAHVIRLSVKPRTPGEHGLPKRAVPELRVTEAGAEGDYNDYRTRSQAGDPDQAILLLSDEVLRQLNAEGWPVRPGDLGENLTLGVVPESALSPGTRLGVGEVLLEVTHRCDPCTELYSLPYVGEARGPEFVRTTVNRRGWYARVLAAGVIRPDMPVTLLKPASRAGAV
jgi:MOSC domain-containing protein YiiM